MSAGCLLVAGVGVYLLPESIAMMRGVAQLARSTVRWWGGVSIDSPYRPEPDLAADFTGRLLDVTVASRLAGRAVPSIESTAYFAVSELLSNAAKHGTNRVQVSVEHRHGLLQTTIVDDGPRRRRPRSVNISAVTKHTASIFTTLELHACDDDNRRLLAVLAHLDS